MITVEHLTKRYGDFTAVKDLSFQIEPGHIYGFLGPNGAGKSTTMNIMAGCLSATAGHVKIDGYDIFEEPREAKRRIGYLPELPPLYRNETPEEYLRFVGEAKGLKGIALREQVDSAIEQTKIGDVAHRRICELSKGYRQRVGIAQALLGDPEVIILDEPTVGLDPIQIIEIRDLIRQLGRDHTVILSSHILSEVQTLCEKILIIAKGELLAFDTPDQLENQLRSPNEMVLTAEAPIQVVSDILDSIPTVTSKELTEKENGMTVARVRTGCEHIYDFSRSVFFAFARNGWALLEINLKKANLEDVFLELTENCDYTTESDPEPAEQAESEVRAEGEDEV